MLFRVGLENNVEGRSLAWALEHPGCFAYGADGDAALDNLPQAIWDYATWIARHNQGVSWISPGEIELSLEETWQVYDVDEDFELVPEGYSVNAWFLHDWKPLTAQELERGLNLLAWGQADLMEVAGGLSQEVLYAPHPGERGSIAGVLKHVGGAEWWYLDRLGLAMPRQELPADPFKRLEDVRAHLVRIFPTLAGSKQVIGVNGEFWSPRKLLRRLVWHERDHVFHVRQLASRFR